MNVPADLPALLDACPFYVNEELSRIGFLPNGPIEDLTERLTPGSVRGDILFVVFATYEQAVTFRAGWDMGNGDDDSYAVVAEGKEGWGAVMIVHSASPDDRWIMYDVSAGDFESPPTSVLDPEESA